MYTLDQTKAPVYDALQKLKENRLVHFDVPSHKGGRGNKLLRDFLGPDCLTVDVNSMKPLDNLCHPTSVIRQSELLSADAFGASDAFFIVNGTTNAVQAMIMATCKPNEKLILPRNVHRSAINALVICGALPVYINPGVDKSLGIPLGMSLDDVEDAILQNPDAKGIFVNNPTYYGVCSDLKKIVELAHKHNMKVLVDEAHGTHFYFGDDMPLSAMKCGADFAAVSTHKTGGSLTQSSFLLCGENIDSSYVRQIINLTQTTSASYLLISSLDLARKNLCLNGKKMFELTLQHARYARAEINKIEGFYAFSKEIVNNKFIHDFDETKLSINTLGIGLAGIEVYDILRDEFNIQIEFGDLANLLCIVSSGDRDLEIERLISSLYSIKSKYNTDKKTIVNFEYINPEVALNPQKAFYSNKKQVKLENSIGQISGEFLMCYPPGIPILAPGEKINEKILEYILYAKQKGCLITGPQDMSIEHINILY